MSDQLQDQNLVRCVKADNGKVRFFPRKIADDKKALDSIGFIRQDFPSELMKLSPPAIKKEDEEEFTIRKNQERETGAEAQPLKEAVEETVIVDGDAELSIGENPKKQLTKPQLAKELSEVKTIDQLRAMKKKYANVKWALALCEEHGQVLANQIANK